MRVCSKCGRALPLEHYHRKKAGYQSWCKECASAWHRDHYAGSAERREGQNARAKQWRLDNPDEYRDKALRIRYGASSDWFEATVLRQGGLCASCRLRPATDIDHDHSCCPGIKSCGSCLRGILCGKCNKGIGLFDDQPDLLTAAATYLEAHHAARD